MEILFQNTYVANKELYKEIYWYAYFQRKFFVFSYFVLAFYFVFNLACALFCQRYSLAMFILIPLLFGLRFLGYFSQIHTTVKRNKEVCDEDMRIETVVTDSCIQQTASNGAVNQIEFGKIRYAVQTKNLILLRSKANLMYVFDKRTFTVGSKEAFVSFLMTKGVKVHGK